MFTGTLKKVVDNVDGGIAAVIMGLDGIPVDTYVRQDGRVDVTTVGMEFSFILSQIRKAADSLQVGGLEELTVRANRLLLRLAMVKGGFIPVDEEWWHFTLENEPYTRQYFDFVVR